MKNILIFVFNISIEDYSGLPTYSEMFLDEYENDNIYIINIIYDRHLNYFIEETTWNKHPWLNCYLPRFFESYYSELPQLILNMIDKYHIDTIIEPDYLMENYLEQLPLYRLGVQKILFLHLLYRGMMDCFTKEPYFESHISLGMDHMARITFYEWKAIKTANIIICNSQFTKKQLERFYWDCGLENKELHAIPLGVNKKEIPYQPCNDSSLWAYFGRLETQKGMVWLEKDFKCNPQLYRENPLIVCGAGSQDSKYMAADMFDKYVKYFGNLPKQSLFPLLKKIKYCIFPSIYEPWGLALNEALAMGKICIVSDKDSGMLEQIEHGVNGILFNFQKESISQFVKDLNMFDNLNFDLISRQANKTSNNIKTHFKKLREII